MNHRDLYGLEAERRRIAAVEAAAAHDLLAPLLSPPPFNLPLEAADGHPFEDDGVSRRCAQCGWWSSTHPSEEVQRLIEEQTAFAWDEGLIEP